MKRLLTIIFTLVIAFTCAAQKQRIHVKGDDRNYSYYNREMGYHYLDAVFGFTESEAKENIEKLLSNRKCECTVSIIVDGKEYTYNIIKRKIFITSIKDNANDEPYVIDYGYIDLVKHMKIILSQIK